MRRFNHAHSAVTLLLAAALLTAGCTLVAPEDDPPDQRAQTPNFTLTDIDGNEFTLATTLGKPVILSFFKTTCSNCQAETPEIVEIYEEYKDAGLVVVAISGEPVEALKKFRDDYSVTYPILHDEGYVVSATQQPAGYGVIDTPTNVFIGRDGYIFRFYEGRPFTREELDILVQAMFQTPSPE